MGSLITDPSFWTLLGPAIFRTNFSHAAAHNNDRVTEFEQHRYMAYFALHLTTFVVAVIQYLLRYHPYVMDLVTYIKVQPKPLTTLVAINGAAWVMVFLACTSHGRADMVAA